MRSLSLYSNDISDAGCAQLAQGAGRSDLTCLELRGNPRIGPAGVRALAAAARANRSLREVHVQTQPGAKRVYAEATEAEEAARQEMEAVTAALAAVLLPRTLH